MRNTKQIYWRHIENLEVASTAAILLARSRQSSKMLSMSAVSKLQLQIANINEDTNPQLVQALHSLINQQQFPSQLLKDSKQFESNIKKLIKLNLIKPSPLLIDALLQLDLEDCCRECLRSKLVPEDVVVDLLSQNPTLFLVDVVRGVSASRSRLVGSIKRGLTLETVQKILEQLCDWCAIRTTLPEIILDKESIPPLSRLAEFLGVLVDAKFSDFINTDHVSIFHLIQTISNHIALTLGAKRNYQKVYGQLFSILESKKSDLGLSQYKPPIEFVEIRI